MVIKNNGRDRYGYDRNGLDKKPKSRKVNINLIKIIKPK